MTVVGIDAHKDWHTLVAVDEVGRRIKELTVEARAAGHRKIMTWLEAFEDVTVAVEDCRHLTRRLEADLREAGHRVVRVHTRLMAGMRRSSRERGKSDPIDAEAVARVALREEGLPTAELPGASRDIKLLSDHRRTLVARRTAMQSKARWFLHEIDPELEIPSRALRRYHLLDELIEYLEPVEGAVAEIALDLLVDIRELPGASRDIKLLSDHRRTLVARRTAMQSKARWFLHEIDPELEIPSRALRRYHLLDELIEYLEPVEGAVAEIALDLLVDIRELT